jgi:hypothetical protein
MIGTVNIKATRGESRHGPNKDIKAPPITFLDGQKISEDSSQELLGSVVTRSLKIREEIKRRAKLGRERIKEISVLWRGTGLSKKRKVQLFEIYIGTKVNYSLETLNFMKKDYEYLDAIQMQMVRIVTKTPPPFVVDANNRSEITNDALRERFEVKRWSIKVQDARRRVFQRNVCRPESHPTYQALFSEEGQEQQPNSKKYPGRPVGNGKSWGENTCRLKHLTVAEGFAQARTGTFYEKHRKWRFPRLREERIDQLINTFEDE